MKRLNIFAVICAVLIALCFFPGCVTQSQGVKQKRTITTYKYGEVVSVEVSSLKLKSRNVEFAYAKGVGKNSMSYNAIDDEVVVDVNGEHEGEAYIPPDTAKAVTAGLVEGAVSIFQPIP